MCWTQVIYRVSPSPAGSSRSHCTKWADDQHKSGRALASLNLHYKTTLCHDLVSSPVWWEAETNIKPVSAIHKPRFQSVLWHGTASAHLILFSVLAVSVGLFGQDTLGGLNLALHRSSQMCLGLVPNMVTREPSFMSHMLRLAVLDP